MGVDCLLVDAGAKLLLKREPSVSPRDDFEQGNLMLAKCQAPDAPKDFCSSYFWRGSCDAGESCIHKADRSHAAVSVALETRVNLLARRKVNRLVG